MDGFFFTFNNYWANKIATPFSNYFGKTCPIRRIRPKPWGTQSLQLFLQCQPFPHQPFSSSSLHFVHTPPLSVHPTTLIPPFLIPSLITYFAAILPVPYFALLSLSYIDSLCSPRPVFSFPITQIRNDVILTVFYRWYFKITTNINSIRVNCSLLLTWRIFSVKIIMTVLCVCDREKVVPVVYASLCGLFLQDNTLTRRWSLKAATFRGTCSSFRQLESQPRTNARCQKKTLWLAGCISRNNYNEKYLPK